MPIQKTALTSPASIAPGISAITALSTTSIVAIERVSAASTRLSAAPTRGRPCSSGSIDSV